jgi:glycine/D-amino acid oxidase-like deaminating enzyme
MNSLWEANSYLTHDLIIIGGGLGIFFFLPKVGLSTACSVLEKHPEQRVIILEKGVIPTGASTKNAALI